MNVTFSSFKGTINLQPTLQTTQDLLSQPTTSIPTSRLTSLAQNNSVGGSTLTKLSLSEDSYPTTTQRKIRTEAELNKLKNSDWILYGKNNNEIINSLDIELSSSTHSKTGVTLKQVPNELSQNISIENEEPAEGPTHVIDDPYFNLIEEEQLSNEMKELFRSSKAVTLWNISEGTSVVTERAKNSAYFMEDFDRYMRSDALTPTPYMPNSRPGTIEKSRPGSRPRISSAILANAHDQLLESERPDTGISVFSGLSNQSDDYGDNRLRKFSANSGTTTLAQNFTPLPKEEIDNDETWRTYQSNPNGRTVVSIYHPETKRPTNIQSFIQKSTVTNESLYTFITTEFIEELNLERCIWIANRILRYIGEFCPHLTVLNLQHCVQLRDSTLTYIASGCKNLISLNIGMCEMVTDVGLSSIFSHCKFLKILSAHSCPRLDGTSLSIISVCPNIEVLDFSYCEKFTDIGLQCIGEYCPSVRHIDLSGCKGIGDEGFLSLVQHCIDLETLRVMLCDQEKLTDSGLKSATRYAFNLRVLELTGVKQLTDEALIEIFKYGRALEFLAISGCENITDAALIHASETCFNLRCIEISRCKKISISGMIDLIHNIKSLSKLVINDCFISDAQLQILEKVTKRCVVIKQTKPLERSKFFFTYTKPEKKKKGKKGGKKSKDGKKTSKGKKKKK